MIWRLWTSIVVSVTIRFFVRDNWMYLFTCFCAGVALAAIGAMIENSNSR